MAGWDAIQLSDFNGPAKPIRIDNSRTRTARVLCKWRKIVHFRFLLIQRRGGTPVLGCNHPSVNIEFPWLDKNRYGPSVR
jgi:hypothetical protein